VAPLPLPLVAAPLGAPTTNETEITLAHEGVIECRGQNSCSDYAENGTDSEYEEASDCGDTCASSNSDLTIELAQ
jgi:hypothetical protein